MAFRLLTNLITNVLIRSVKNFCEKMFPIMLIRTQEVEVAEGKLRGRVVKSQITNDIYFSFLGIPYGKPPVGTLRFSDPEPAETWSGIREAFYEGNCAPQLDLIFHLQYGAEDCLFLNVHTPKLPSSDSDSELLPVIFYIHGGAFLHGNGNSEVYGPEYLIQHNVVVVTCNYRMGALGFLSLGTEKVSGNFGLKDQLLALRWVNRNIAVFGGDPNNVTLYGGSAGAASVHFHILSPKSKGLFHRAIAQSGNALNPWTMTEYARERAFRIGESLGCKTDNDQVLMDFLRTVSPWELAKNSQKAISKTELGKLGNSMLPFLPVVEPPSPNAFLSEDPRVLLEEGRFAHVPCIFAINSCEGMVYLKVKKMNKKLEETLDKDPAGITINSFQKLLDKTKKRNEFGQKIKKFYAYGNSLNRNETKIFDMFSDYYFVKGVFDSVQYHVKALQPDIKIYFLFFSFEGSIGLLKNLLNAYNLKGVCHADDLAYVFPLWIFNLNYAKNSPEEKIVYQMTKRITNFAKTSDPNCEDLEGLNVAWLPATKDHFYYLDLNLNPQMKENLFCERMNFWNDVNRMLGLKSPQLWKM